MSEIEKQNWIHAISAFLIFGNALTQINFEFLSLYLRLAFEIFVWNLSLSLSLNIWALNFLYFWAISELFAYPEKYVVRTDITNNILGLWLSYKSNGYYKIARKTQMKK